jgi:hypothetical protein
MVRVQAVGLHAFSSIDIFTNIFGKFIFYSCNSYSGAQISIPSLLVRVTPILSI